MCHVWKKSTNNEMTSADARRAFTKIPTVRAIRITGGEPFLREDLLSVLSEILANTRVEIFMIITNGILTERIVELVKKLRYPYLRLNISLTGYGQRADTISGIKGIFEKVVKTIENLKAIQERYRFSMVINHVIFNMASFEDSQLLRKLCSGYGIAYLPILEFQESALYEENNCPRICDPNAGCATGFNVQELGMILCDLLGYAKGITDPFQRFFKRYYLQSLYNCFVLNKKRDNVPCITLQNRIRILPNGDIPVCMYNSHVVGNIVRDDFYDMWNSEKVEYWRRWRDQCVGCHLECELHPNMIYSGKILNYLFQLF
jgi:Fe-coproporphyrin III synthase